jgi:hypothetical protein
VEVSANWYDGAGPSSALVNVDGACTALELERGTPENGTYHVALTGLGACHRYYFVFEDPAGEIVTCPPTGSLGIGPADTCPTWNEDRPATGPSCSCTPSCDGRVCGDDTCGGSCGSCGAGETCEAGVCVPDPTGTGGSGGSAGASGGGAGASGGSAGASGSGTGGSGNTTGGGSGGNAGSPSATDDGSEAEGGCGCVAAGRSTGSALAGCFALLGLLLLRRRRT